MSLSLGLVISIILIGAVILTGVLLLVFLFFKKVEQGKALIVNTMVAEPVVTFTGRIVLPVIHKSEVMDISLKTIDIDRRGREGLICRDNIRADIRVTFFVRVNKTPEDVLKVAQSIGCERASDRSTLEELFIAKFSEALKTVGKQLDFEDLYKERDSFRDKIIQLIGTNLNGYVLEDAAIDFLEQTPIGSLDPQNILDSQGIRKITELTSNQNVLTNEFKNQEQMKITQQNVQAKEAILELERQKSDAEARQAREIRNAQDREQAEMEVVAAQERLKSEAARIQTEEQLEVQAQNKQREIEVAEQNRLRVVGIETERVQLAREQEQIAREREIELQQIAKEKALEVERREIANVIRERVAVDKTVAQEEESIKELREVAEAQRQKQVLIIEAEAKAQESLVTDIKKAEAANEAAKFRVQEQGALAESEREVAEKQAAAKIRLAEGTQAEAAAKGLAEVKVREANAVAIQKEGAAQAQAELDRMQAEAKGTEEKGLAQLRVRKVELELVEQQGIAEAKATRERMQAEAWGEEQKGLATVHVQEAEAEAIEKQGMAKVKVREAEAQTIEKEGAAEAAALQMRLQAEAAGLVEKYKALDTLSGEGRQHEEYRLRLEQQLAVQKLSLEMQQRVAEHQAQVLAEGLKQAKIDIVGGDSMFLDRLMNSLSAARAVDGFVDHSQTVQQLLSPYLGEDADANLVQDLKGLIGQSGLSAQDIQHLTVSAFLARLMRDTPSAQQPKIEQLQKVVQQLGLGDLRLGQMQ